MNPQQLFGFLWPLSSIDEALQALLNYSRFITDHTHKAPMPDLSASCSEENINQWLQTAAVQLGIEIEPVDALYGEVEKLLEHAGPALLQITIEERTAIIALIGKRAGLLHILTPDLKISKIPVPLIASLLRAGCEAPFKEQIAKIVLEAGVPEKQRLKACTAILRQKLSQHRITGCWILKLSPGAGFLHQLKSLKTAGQLFALFGAHAVQYCLFILSWIVIGQGALEGSFDYSRLATWILLLFSIIPFRMAVQSLEGRVVAGVWGTLKQRLLFGALRLHPDEIRHQGIGQFLGRVVEADGIEMMGVMGAFLSGLALVEIAAALIILLINLFTTGFVLIGWLAITAFAAFHFYKKALTWTNSRLSMTNDLVERMTGQRTRLAQESPDRWHHGEDDALYQYAQDSKSYDKNTVLMTIVIPVGWLVAAFFVLAFDYISGRLALPSLAAGTGGILLVYRSLRSLVAGLFRVIGALVAWKQAEPLYHAALREEVKGVPLPGCINKEQKEDTPLSPVLSTSDLMFCYQSRPEPVLNKCRITIYPGQRVLLEGPSGCGKSTLAAIISGLREPDSGLIFLHGLDKHTYGDTDWHRRIATAPQFHENHILSETFLFNVLMGRTWPPSDADIKEAGKLCRELGLGELLDKMPGHIMQMIGDTGWQLSHGEKSRLYIARAILQDADLIVLDESFAALDPGSLNQAMSCVLKRAPALLVIAHP